MRDIIERHKTKAEAWCGRGNNWLWPMYAEILCVPLIYRQFEPTLVSIAAVVAFYVVRWTWRGSWPWHPPKRGWW